MNDSDPKIPRWSSARFPDSAEIVDDYVSQACAVIVAKVTCPYAPLQIQGWVGGLPFEFRSRHGRWTIGDYGAGDWDVSSVGEALLLVLECPHYKQQLWNWSAASRTA